MPERDTVEPAPDTDPTVGVATIFGLLAGAVQYVTALVILIVGGPTEAAIAALVTATGSLVTVLGGRYKQAAAKGAR